MNILNMKFIINLFSLGRSYHHHWSTIGDPLSSENPSHRRPPNFIGDLKLFIGDPKFSWIPLDFRSETPKFYQRAMGLQ